MGPASHSNKAAGGVDMLGVMSTYLGLESTMRPARHTSGCVSEGVSKEDEGRATLNVGGDIPWAGGVAGRRREREVGASVFYLFLCL